MDAVLQSHFARVESALSTLVESIATYNPSTQAALDLVAADDDLSEGLDQLSHHQANHARILALRAEAEALEAQVKSSVSTLADLRRELYKTPATAFPDDSRPVPVDELLAYARKIASYTVPPTYRELAPPKAAGEEEQAGAANGVVGTPAGAAAAGTVATTSADPSSKDPADGDNAALKEVTEEQAEWIKKLQESGSTWTPYPHNTKIWGGNLMAIQRHLLDFKKDPWKESVEIDGDVEADANARDRDAGEASIKADQSSGPKREESADSHPAPQRKESVVVVGAKPPPVEEKPRQQFNLFDDFEDDD
ncbi:hypothetical protein BU24DRAFT_97049 [Aaosphaeria arxii CBS 175.79]|uniref:Mediator of RNA polymerase II transcription subunit 4 n=1 Tax=Aaosphaeria arxii CBS 175.79 TaxID=1450172 RepID=A0A6A5X6D2_9PLEO|nr:uncharacterized protein BU24DRAFT_97049 [Aaosphaeria arxii CBS 175.79]KAF2008460.1 hypothetical protein BU24DRAFT_97049 [Aaosphaeria arxii CBS 175.79]